MLIEMSDAILQTQIVAGGGCENGWQGYGKSCASYHAIFPRLAEVYEASSPLWHKEFYRSAIGSAVVDRGMKAPDVLVLGTATTELPRMVREEIDSLNPEARLTVADICNTPLITSRTLGIIRPGVDRTIKLDALDSGQYPQEEYMGIFTDAFLTRFTPEQRKQVLANIATHTHPYGHFVTTWRIGNGSYGDMSAKSRFMERCIEKLNPKTLGELLAINDYADTMTSYADGLTVEQIRSEVQAYFQDVRVEESGVVWDVTPRKYARIIAYQPIK